MNEKNDFVLWMEEIHLNKKQVTIAGELIGLKLTTASLTVNNKREPSLTDRLAMSAVLVGLPAFSRDTLNHVVAVKALKEIVENEVERRLEEMQKSGDLIVPFSYPDTSK